MIEARQGFKSEILPSLKKNEENKMAYKKLKNAFTLIELLVVISIIALLLSILMPALGKAKEVARKVVCASNLKQVGLVEQLYANDYNKWIPRYVPTNDWANDGDVNFKQQVTTILPYSMHKPFYDFLRDSYDISGSIWRCPSLVGNRKGRDNFIQEGTEKVFELIDSKDGGTVRRELTWEDQGLTRFHAGSSIFPRPGVLLGYARLVGLYNYTAGGSGSSINRVKDSAITVYDSSTKRLAADINLRWDSWEHNNSWVAHLSAKGLPRGGNSLFADLHVDWRNSTQMADEDQPVTVSPDCKGRYSHTGDENRAYFW